MISMLARFFKAYSREIHLFSVPSIQGNARLMCVTCHLNIRLF
jgi:hypothetical protein